MHQPQDPQTLCPGNTSRLRTVCPASHVQNGFCTLPSSLHRTTLFVKQIHFSVHLSVCKKLHTFCPIPFCTLSLPKLLKKLTFIYNLSQLKRHRFLSIGSLKNNYKYNEKKIIGKILKSIAVTIANI